MARLPQEAIIRKLTFRSKVEAFLALLYNVVAFLYLFINKWCTIEYTDHIRKTSCRGVEVNFIKLESFLYVMTFNTGLQ